MLLELQGLPVITYTDYRQAKLVASPGRREGSRMGSQPTTRSKSVSLDDDTLDAISNAPNVRFAVGNTTFDTAVTTPATIATQLQAVTLSLATDRKLLLQQLLDIEKQEHQVKEGLAALRRSFPALFEATM